MINQVIILNEFDSNGDELESFEVALEGVCADEFSISSDYFDTVEDAYEFAEDVVNTCGAELIWKCYQPGWAL